MADYIETHPDDTTTASNSSSQQQRQLQYSPDEKSAEVRHQGDGGLDTRAAAHLDTILFPPDIYTKDKVYWADLPLKQKTRWVNEQSNAEARRELGVIGAMFKKDPLSPISAYFRNYVVTGLGLFVEGYVLFSVGNLTPLFRAIWPACWKTYETCDEQWVHAVDYLEIIGIIFGQIIVGIEGDWIGRRFGMVQDALVMTLGSIMLTAMWGTTLNGWVICYAWSLFIYGFGVGGEYPMTSTRAMEGMGRGQAATTGDRMHRGRNTALAFLMQGWGQLFNQGVLIVALLVFHGSLEPTFSKTSTQWTFRVQFGVIALPTIYLAYLRYYKLTYTDQALRDAKKRNNTSGYDVASLKLAISWYWHRMIGTALVWFINDVLFYGSKIFSGVFIEIITGTSGNIKVTWLYNLLNVGISLVGYYLGALLIDHKQYGRKWMQANGLLAIFVIFLICAVLYNKLAEPGAGSRWFMALYFLSSFFTQFGPNTTSFLLAAEVYPATVRSTAHGVSAATGKMGALLAAVVYNYIGSRTKFIFVVPFGFAGWLLTLIFVPDTTGLDLREQERYFEYVLKGRTNEYHGIAVHPRHLSLFERVILKRHLNYDPEKDRAAKIEELRAVYESVRAADKEGGLGDMDDDQRVFLENELDGFFANERKLTGNTVVQAPGGHHSKLAELETKLS